MLKLLLTIVFALLTCINNHCHGLNLFDEVKKRLMPKNDAPFIAKELFQTIFEEAGDHDAKFLHKSIKEFLDNKDILVEILITRNRKQLDVIKNRYKLLFGHELSADIASVTRSNYRALLLALLNTDRDESDKTDQTAAEKDAQRLYKAGEKRLGTDEELFIQLFTSQNVRQLRSVFDADKLTGNSMEKALDSEFSGDELDAFMDIVSFVRKGPSGVLGRLMQKAITGESNDELLVHLIYSYKRLNLLGMLQDEFKHGFTGPLSEAVKDRAKSTLLKNALINLISG